jgi:hypothetical protein
MRRVRRDVLALHEQDAAHNGFALRDHNGGGAVETAARYKGLALTRLLLEKLLNLSNRSWLQGSKAQG